MTWGITQAHAVDVNTKAGAAESRGSQFTALSLGLSREAS